MTLIESINKRAEEKYPEHPTGTASVVNHYAIEFEQPAYISGCRDQYELDMDFAIFVVVNDYVYHKKTDYDNGGWSQLDNYSIPLMTTEQLFERWLNNVKK